jgi:hypothetical protein
MKSELEEYKKLFRTYDFDLETGVSTMRNKIGQLNEIISGKMYSKEFTAACVREREDLNIRCSAMNAIIRERAQ